MDKKIKLYNQVFWDYKVSTKEIEDFINDKSDHIIHCDKENIFKRVIESYNWETVIILYSKKEIKEFLTGEFINKLKTASLRKNYELIKKSL